MPRILITVAFAVTAVLSCSCAYARGGGNSSPWESPYAILEPQTVAASSEVEGLSSLSEKSDRIQRHGAGVHHRRHWRHRQDTNLER
jgi:hypothetical protein